MPMTKITLSIDRKIKDKANAISRRKKTSISAMFSRYVAAMDAREAENDLPPLTRRALELSAGTPQLPEAWDYRTELADILDEKHGLK